MDLVTLRRLHHIESERHLNGRWDGLVRLLEKWTPHIQARRDGDHADLYDHLAAILVRAAEQRETPPLSVVKPPQKVVPSTGQSGESTAVSDAG